MTFWDSFELLLEVRMEVLVVLVGVALVGALLAWNVWWASLDWDDWWEHHHRTTTDTCAIWFRQYRKHYCVSGPIRLWRVPRVSKSERRPPIRRTHPPSLLDSESRWRPFV